MQFSIITALCFTSVAVALPQVSSRTAYQPCNDGLYASAQCCATDVLGVVGLNCAGAPYTPTSAEHFDSICAANGQQAKCCVLPVAGQDVLCQDPPAGAKGVNGY